DRESGGGGIAYDRIAPLVHPVREAARACDAAKVLHIEHGHQAFAVPFDVGACDAPEVRRLRAWGVSCRAGKMIRPHINPGGLAVAFVAREVRISSARSLRRFGPGERDAGGMYARPGNTALVMGDINAQRALR